MSKVFERRNQAMYDTVRSNMTFINLPLYLLKLCVSDYGFTLKRAPSNLLKRHHIRYAMGC